MPSIPLRTLLLGDQLKLLILRELLRKDAQSVGAVTRKTGARFQSTLRASLFLEAMGWISIEEFPGDTRTTRYLRLTETGREHVRLAFAKVSFPAS